MQTTECLGFINQWGYFCCLEFVLWFHTSVPFTKFHVNVGIHALAFVVHCHFCTNNVLNLPLQQSHCRAEATVEWTCGSQGLPGDSGKRAECLMWCQWTCQSNLFSFAIGQRAEHWVYTHAHSPCHIRCDFSAGAVPRATPPVHLLFLLLPLFILLNYLPLFLSTFSVSSSRFEF